MHKPSRTPRIFTGAEYLSLQSDQTWLIEPLLPVGGSMALYGDPKVGKSFAALQLGASIVEGSNWLGFPIRHPGPVVYIQLDTPRSLWVERTRTLTASGLRVDRIHQADRESLDAFPFDILRADHSQMLRELLRPIKPVAVIIDTLRECHSNQENDATDMQPVIAALEEACQPAALILVAHARKPSGEPGNQSTINDIRGSNYIPGRMDAIVRFTPRGMSVEGRAIERATIRLERLENATWGLNEAEDERVALLIIDDPAYPGIRAKARALAERTGRKEESARSMIRRLMVREKGVGHVEGGSQADPPLLRGDENP